MEKLNVGILVFDGVEVLDFAGPFEVFSRTRLISGTQSRLSDESAPFRTFLVARTNQPAHGTGDFRVLPHFSFSDAPGIDILVVPGGFGTRGLLNDQETLSWIRNTADNAKHTTSVCTGALLLAQAGLLRNRKATTHWGAYDLLESLQAGVIVIRDQRVVIDTVFTSAGVSAGIEMAFAVVETLFGRQVAEETAHYIEYRLPGEAVDQDSKLLKEPA
jgi:transcriptional regulator GlxA family with amidase domain